MCKRVYFYVICIPVLFTALLGCNSSNDLDFPINKSATSETNSLYKNLKTMQYHATMLGHQDDLAYGVNWQYEPGRSDIKDVTGDYPALVGWEIGQLELDNSVNLDSVPFAMMRQFIVEGYEMGMVNTISWHTFEPVTGFNSWVDKDSTKTVVAQIIPGGALHHEYNIMLSKVADFFLSLKTKNGTLIPVIFRPFHENNGDWFWWGQKHCTTEQYKILFQYTVDYLLQHDVNNVLFAYSPDRFFTTTEEYLERYPGDQYVDVIGFDDYQSLNQENGVELLGQKLEIVNTLAKERNKLSAFTETGVETMPDTTWFTEKLYKALKYSDISDDVSYVMLWRNDNITHFYSSFKGHSSAENLNAFFKKEDISFRKDLPELYK